MGEPVISVDGDGSQGHCREVIDAMYLFIDNEQLTDEQRAHVQAHLDDCIPCLEAFELEVELKKVIAKRCQDEAPAWLYERVRTMLSAEVSWCSNAQGGTSRKPLGEGIPPSS